MSHIKLQIPGWRESIKALEIIQCKSANVSVIRLQKISIYNLMPTTCLAKSMCSQLYDKLLEVLERGQFTEKSDLLKPYFIDISSKRPL